MKSRCADEPTPSGKTLLESLLTQMVLACFSNHRIMSDKERILNIENKLGKVIQMLHDLEKGTDKIYTNQETHAADIDSLKDRLNDISEKLSEDLGKIREIR